MSTEIEKKSLEAHVELCAERYSALDHKIESLNEKVEKLESHIVYIREKLSDSDSAQSKQFITIGISIVAALIGGIIALIVHSIK
jgi:predicted  nucleic acid-binding Zn-ribbon protein